MSCGMLLRWLCPPCHSPVPANRGTGAMWSGEPALSEAEGNLRFLFWFFHKIVILSEAPNRFIA